MVQRVVRTHEETMKMYMQFPKKDLVVMLIEANREIIRLTPMTPYQVTSGSGVLQTFRTVE